MRLALPALLLIVAACGSPSGNDGPTDDASLDQGRRLALANCAGCHAIDATSPSTHAEAPPFRTLSENYEVSNLQEALVEGIVVGHPDMPEFQFEPGEADALIAFIESLQTES